MTAALLAVVMVPAWATLQRQRTPLVPLESVALPMPALVDRTASDLAAANAWQSATVHPGQSLAAIFAEQGLDTNDLERVVATDAGQSKLSHLRPGQRFEFIRGAEGELRALRYDHGDDQRVLMRFEGQLARKVVEARRIERVTRVAHGVITDSLFTAGTRAGMSHALVLALAKVFGYDIDFVQDLREGDYFTVVYDNIYRDGEYLRSGDIIGAEFVNRGRRFTAFRYTLPDGSTEYFSEDGRPKRKSFLRTPIDFRRIASRFSSSRMHPILGRMRAHKGVDYAAPSGTPIFAAGDGKVTFCGWAHGYGKFVLIRHNRDISTAYGHMSRFAARLHRGARVRQGEIIGYVGMTGLATGPHLHYEFRIDGQQRDPMTVTLPRPAPLPVQLRLAFQRSILPALSQIEQIDARFRLASTN